MIRRQGFRQHRRRSLSRRRLTRRIHFDIVKVEIPGCEIDSTPNQWDTSDENRDEFEQTN